MVAVMSALVRPWKPAALCALALGACQATPRSDGGLRGNVGRAVEPQEPASAVAESFRAWAYALPSETELPPMTGTMSFSMQGDLSAFAGEDYDALALPPGAEPDFSMTFQGRLELQSWTRLRAQMDMVMDLGPLKAQSDEPLVVGLLLIADGETVWIEPDWSQAWFLDQLEGQATGFERLVFTIGTATVKEFMEAVAGTIQGEAAEWYRKSLECAANPACLARLLADHATVESFARRGPRVVADLSMDMSEWMPPELKVGEGFGPFRYRCEFDAATGAVLRTSYTWELPDGGMSMAFQQEMEIAAKPFAAERFTYRMPEGRQAFPVDLFVKPVLAGIRMESGQQPPDDTADDLPF